MGLIEISIHINLDENFFSENLPRYYQINAFHDQLIRDMPTIAAALISSALGMFWIGVMFLEVFSMKN